jgi:hypothetical protein
MASPSLSRGATGDPACGVLLLAKLREALAQSTANLSTQTTPISSHETGSIPARAAM